MPNAASPSTTAHNRIATDLAQSIATGWLRRSRLSPVIRTCCMLHDVTTVSNYEFARLEEAILLADDLFEEAGELIALGKDARQEVLFAIGYVVVGLVQICKPSNRLKYLIVDVCEAIVSLDEIDGAVRWRRESKQTLYRNALVAMTPVDSTVISILEEVVEL